MSGWNVLLQYREFLKGKQLFQKWILLAVLLLLRVFATGPTSKEISSDMYVMF